MLSSLLSFVQAAGYTVAAAVPHAGHGEAPSGLSLITQEFGIDWPFILAQIFSFTVVAFLLWKLAFKPVLATIDERQKTIASGLKYAEDTKAQLAAAQQESAVFIKNAQLEATKIIDEARKTAKELAERETAAATERANALISKAQQAIDLEHKKMLDEARTEIARLVVTTTQRVLAKELSDADRARYNDAASRELTLV